MKRIYKKMSRRDVAAYLLDRADQYETESACWVALSDAAWNIMRCDAVNEALNNGDLDDELYARVDSFAESDDDPKVPRPVRPRDGVDDE